MGKSLSQITFDFAATEEAENTPETTSSVIEEEKVIMEVNKPAITITEEKQEPVIISCYWQTGPQVFKRNCHQCRSDTSIPKMKFFLKNNIIPLVKWLLCSGKINR